MARSNMSNKDGAILLDYRSKNERNFLSSFPLITNEEAMLERKIHFGIHQDFTTGRPRQRSMIRIQSRS